MVIQNNTIVALVMITLVASGIYLIPTVYVYADAGCHNEFIFNWFTNDPVLECLDDAISGVSAESTVCSNAGSGAVLVKTSVSGNCVIKTLVGSGDISITNTTNTVVIDFNGTIASSESTVCYNVGTGYLIVKNTTSGSCYLKSLLAGTGITVSNGTNTITVTNAITNVENLLNTNINSPQNGEQLTYNSTSGKWENHAESEIDVGGGYSLFYTTVGNILEFKTLLAGSGIGISSSATAVTISNTSPESTTCSNLGTGAGGYGIYKTGNCTFKSIKPSTGISMTNNTNDITITNSSPESTTCTSAGGTTIVKLSGGNCTFYGLTAGTGLSITQNANDNQYTNSGVISNSCSSGISCSGTNPSSFTNSGVTSNVAGTGISVSGATGAVTVSNTGVITNSCSAPISCSGTNPSLLSCATCSTNSAQETTVCNNIGSGTWIIRNSTSGNCNVKTLAVSTGLSISNSTTLITFTNSGVISNSCSSGITCSGTNPSSISLTSQSACSSGQYVTAVSGTSTCTTAVVSGSCTSPISCSGTNPLAISCSTCVTSVPVDDVDLACSGSYSSGTSQTCSISPTYKFYLVNIYVVWGSGGTSGTFSIRFNSDSGNNYAFRTSSNGGADATTGSTSSISLGTTCVALVCGYDCMISNVASGQEKTSRCLSVDDTTAGAGNPPSRFESYGKWANTASQITSITILHSGTKAFASGTEVRVFGWN